MSFLHEKAVSRHFRSRRTEAPPGHRPPADPHLVLQIDRHETDTLRIILAAQIQLRRWRRVEPGRQPAGSLQRIREIIAARESLLAQAVGRNRIFTPAAEPSLKKADSDRPA